MTSNQPPTGSTATPSPDGGWTPGSVGAGSLLLGGAILLGEGQVLTRWTPTNPQQQQVYDAVAQWAPTVGWGATTVGLGLVAGSAIAARRHPRGGAGRKVNRKTARVLGAASPVLGERPDTLRLTRARWRRGGLRRGVLHYTVDVPLSRPTTTASDGMPTEDRDAALTAAMRGREAALAEALRPYIAGPVKVTWEPRKDRFRIIEKAPEPVRVEDTSPALRTLVDALTHMIPGLVVDQRHTTLYPDLSVAQLVTSYPLTTRDIGDGFRARVQLVLDAKSPAPTGFWSLLWDPAAGTVTVAPALALPQQVPYPLLMPDLHDPDARLQLPVGVAEGGQVVTWDPRRSPHMLLAGPTGTGKTIFLNAVIMGALVRGWDVYLADPKELSFRGLPGWGGIRAIATSEDEMEAVIGTVYRLLRERYRQLKDFEINEDELQPILLVVDEAGELVERLNAYQTSHDKHQALIEAAIAAGRDPDEVKKPTGTKNAELGKIWSLLRLGRQALIQVIIATQRPDVSFIPGEARSNLVSKVGLGRLDGAGLEMVFGTRSVQQRTTERVVDGETGRTVLKAIRGRAVVDMGHGLTPVQGLWVPDPAQKITGELNPADTQLVDNLYDLVTAARAANDARVQALPTQPAPPNWFKGGRGEFESDAALDADLARGSWDLSREESLTTLGGDAEGCELDPDTLSTVHGRDLQPGATVLLEVDRRLTLCVIEDVEPDPFSSENDLQLQVSYRVADSDDRAGQAGVTTLDESEQLEMLAA